VASCQSWHPALIGLSFCWVVVRRNSVPRDPVGKRALTSTALTRTKRAEIAVIRPPVRFSRDYRWTNWPRSMSERDRSAPNRWSGPSRIGYKSNTGTELTDKMDGLRGSRRRRLPVFCDPVRPFSLVDQRLCFLPPLDSRSPVIPESYALRVINALMPIASRISCSRDIATVWYSVSS